MKKKPLLENRVWIIRIYSDIVATKLMIRRHLMKSKHLTALAAGTCLLSLPVLAEDLAIINANVFDATGAAPYAATVVIKDDKIAAIDKSGATPDGMTILDAGGKALLPGLYDLHVHYTSGGEPAATPQISQAYIAAGVTSVFDFHQAPEAFAPQRAWLESLPGPHVNLAARMSTTNGHGATWSDQTTTKWVNTPYAAVEAVEELIPYQPDLIKVFADGWRYGSGVDDTSINEPTLTALVKAAHEHGLPVVTHTVTVERSGIAARSGIDSQVHSILDKPIDEATLADLVASDMSYAGTLAVYQADKPEITDFERSNPAFASRMERYTIGLGNMKTIYDAGVPITLGTDAGMRFTPHGESTLRELEQMVRAGLTPMDALIAGTANSAKAVDQYEERGSVEVGKAADLFLVDGKPWENISEVRNIKYTWVAGERMFGPGAPEIIASTYIEPNTPEIALINDFDSKNGRTTTGGLVTGDPDGGKERSFQIFEIIQDDDRGGILRLNATLARREEARVGVIFPMNPGNVQPMNISAYDGFSMDIRGDGGEYTVTLLTTDGRFSWVAPADDEWSTVKLDFTDLTSPSEGVGFTGEGVYNIRVNNIRPGDGEPTWFDIDNVTFY
jgi:imidazolonepropionase-like amidohydrolase